MTSELCSTGLYSSTILKSNATNGAFHIASTRYFQKTTNMSAEQKMLKITQNCATPSETDGTKTFDVRNRNDVI